MSGFSPDSVPFFSADDRTIESSDGENVSTERALFASGQQNVPLAFQTSQRLDTADISTTFSDDGLYSFYDSAIKPRPLKTHPQESRTQITSSFGVSPDMYNSRSSSVSDWRGQSPNPVSDSKESTPVPSDVPPTDLLPSDVPPTDPVPSDVSPTDLLPLDLPPTDPVPSDVPPTDLLPLDLPPTDPVPSDVPPTDPVPSDVPPDVPSTDPVPSDVPPTDPVPSDAPPTDKVASASCQSDDETSVDITGVGRSETPECHSPSAEPQHDFSVPLRNLSRIDSDIETSSVVSIQQLTETFLSDVPGHDGNLAAAQKSLSSHSIPIAESLPSHLQPLPVLPPSVEAATSAAMTPLKSPIHLQSSPYKPLLSNGHSFTHSFQHSMDYEEKSLKQQLTQALQEKANLEGQLESVLEECKTALSDRAELQSRVARVEAEKAEMADMLETQVQYKPETSLQENSYDFEELKAALKEAKQAVESEKKRVLDLKNNVSKEKLTSAQLQGELTDVKKVLAEKDEVISELQMSVKHHLNEQEKKQLEVDEAKCKLSALEASYGTLEETKSWLHAQLEESLKEKQLVQEELREVKTTAMTQSIKTDQLTKENTSFQKQIADLQQGILHDKARLVNELEAIEADVLSREDSYSRLVAEKAQLEHIVRKKEHALEQMSADLARSQVENEESHKKIEDLETENIAARHKMDELFREKSCLGNLLQSNEKQLAAKDIELKELDQLKRSLQEKCRQSDAALIGKEGTIQGLNDAKEILRHELAMVKQDRNTIDAELNEAKMEMTKLETELMDVEHKLQDRISQLQSVCVDKESLQSDNEELKSNLEEKERQLDEKTQLLQTLEDQSSDLIGQFKSLEGRFQSIASNKDDTDDEMVEKDRVIAHLAAEKDKMESELATLRDQNQTLDSDLSKLQEEQAQLQGQIEVSSSTASEEMLKLGQDKSQLQAEMNSLKMSHQQEVAKMEAKLKKMEMEVKYAKREASRAAKDLQILATEKKDELKKLGDALSKAHADTKDARSKMEKALREKDHILNTIPAQAEQQELHRLRANCLQLAEENQHLSEKIRCEANQKEELERAGIKVATQLKQNAEEDQKKLQHQIRELSLELEKLKGRLTGMTTAKNAMREHVAKMEGDIAKKEASLVRLSAQVQKVLSAKEVEDESLNAQITSLEEQLEESKKIAETANQTATAEHGRVVELEHELGVRDLEVAELIKTVEQVRGHDLVSLKKQVSVLEEEKTAAQTEVGELKSQLMSANSARDVAIRELTDKETQCRILHQELDLSREQCQQVVEEKQMLKERLEQLTTETVQHTRPFETSLSTIEGDETDGVSVSGASQSSEVEKMERLNDTLRESSQQTIDQLVGYNSLYRAHLKEMGARLEQARKQGQESAELKKSGEITVLRKELGSKSRTITGLQSCLLSLKDDMDKLHHQMDQHSAAVHDSYKSSRQIESRIKNLKKNH